MDKISKIKTTVHRLRVQLSLTARLVTSDLLFDYMNTSIRSNRKLTNKTKQALLENLRKKSNGNLYAELLKDSLVKPKLTLVVEDRLIPFVAMGNSRKTPLLYLDLYAQNLRLTTREIWSRKLPAIKFNIKGTKFRDEYLQLRALRDAKYRSIPVGLWALEGVLRTEKNFGGLELDSQKLEYLLEEKIKDYCSICERIHFIMSNWDLNIAIFSHDCYWFGAVNDTLAEGNVTTIPMPKGYYNKPIVPKETEIISENLILNRRRSSFLDLVENVGKSTIVRNLDGQLPYMKEAENNHEFFKKLKSYSGFEEFNEITLPSELKAYGYGSIRLSDQIKTWVFALHSFADETCVWGNDGFYTHFDFFLPIAKAINKYFPNDIILVRPHPNVFARTAEAENLNVPRVVQLDQTAQRVFCKKLQSECENVFIGNPFQEIAQINDYSTMVFVTRWGTIGIEAVEKLATVICSKIAPYSDALANKLFSLNRDSMEDIASLVIGARAFESKNLSHLERVFINCYNQVLRMRADGEPRVSSIDITSEYQDYVKGMVPFRKGFKQPSIAEQKLFIKYNSAFRGIYYKMLESDDLRKHSLRAMPCFRED